MFGKIFLSGGGDGKTTFEIDEIFFDEIKKILYIPVAKRNNYRKCKEWLADAIKQHKKIEIDMLTDLAKSPKLENYDAVYIGGGNTFKLLKEIKDSNFGDKLLKYLSNGGTIYGGSAGAIIFGKSINTALICDIPDTNYVRLKDTKGFNKLKGHDVQVHYTNGQLKKNQKYSKKTKTTIIAIPEGSALLVENGKYKIIGTKSITVITKNSARDFKPDELISL